MEENIINILSEDTVDKIAAGEVVERPSSVVKELVENSIDSGADSVSVSIRGGGITEIRISDNGSGIMRSEIRKAFMPHATSKIRKASDLDSIHTLGFRGEALSSIAAVSNVHMITKASDDDLGTDYIIEGGKEISNGLTGAPDGTTLIVRNLFFNTPARRKFLKSEKTESIYIEDVLCHIAISHPEISFSFKSDGHDRMMTSGNSRLIDSIYQIYGREIASNLIPLKDHCDLFSVDGFIGNYSLVRGNRSLESFYINKRSVIDKVLSKALEDGYKGFLMKRQFPFAVLFFSFPEGSVDVNVHPSKREVRISDSQAVMENLTEMIHKALSGREDILEPVKAETAKEKLNESESETDNNHSGIILDDNKKISSETKSSCTDNSQNEERIWKNPKNLPEPFEKSLLSSYTEKIDEELKKNIRHDERVSDIADKAYNTDSCEQISFISEESRPDINIIGQIFKTYWIIEWNKKVYIIDQHAAHEKVNYERMIGSLRNHTMTSQELMPPVIVSLSAKEIDSAEKIRDEMEAIGYRYESFGGKEYMISAMPGNLPDIDLKSLFINIVSEASQWNNKFTSDMIEERIATMSCKASIKGNQFISRDEAYALFDELLSLDEPYHCPHGRPTMIAVSREDLDKLFRRIV